MCLPQWLSYLNTPSWTLPVPSAVRAFTFIGTVLSQHSILNTPSPLCCQGIYIYWHCLISTLHPEHSQSPLLSGHLHLLALSYLNTPSWTLPVPSAVRAFTFIGTVLSQHSILNTPSPLCCQGIYIYWHCPSELGWTCLKLRPFWVPDSSSDGRLFKSPPSKENGMVAMLSSSLLHKSGILFVSFSITAFPTPSLKLVLKRLFKLYVGQ